MSVINFRRKEISAKIVYYGPALSGKTTNVKKIHDSIPASRRGKLTSLATKEDRTLFFDYVPIHLGNIGGFKTKFQIFTVPGQVIYASTRRIVLQGVDGVVFVADSTPGSMEANLESLTDLRENLLHHDKHLNALPMVIQYNKRDLDDKIPIEDLESELNLLSVPSFRAAAINGMGVLETLSKVSSLVLTYLKASIEGRLVRGRSDPSVIQRFDDEEMDDAALVRDLMAQIARVRPGEIDSDIEIVDDAEEEIGENAFDDSSEDAATRLIALPPRPARNQLAHDRDDAESATLSGASTTLVASSTPAPSPPPPRTTKEALRQAQKTAGAVDSSPAPEREATTNVTDLGSATSMPSPGEPASQAMPARHAPPETSDGLGVDETDLDAGATSREMDAGATPPSGIRSDPGAEAATGPQDAAAEGAVDPLADAPFPKEETTEDSTDYHIAALRVAPPPEQLAGLADSRESDASEERAGHPPRTPTNGRGGTSTPSLMAQPSQPSTPSENAERPGPRPPTPRPGPRLVEAPPMSLPTSAGLEVLDVGRPVRDKEGVWAIPVTVRTPGDESPSVVVFRCAFDDTDLPEQRMAVPTYVLAWLAGLTLLTLLGLGLTLF